MSRSPELSMDDPRREHISYQEPKLPLIPKRVPRLSRRHGFHPSGKINREYVELYLAELDDEAIFHVSPGDNKIKKNRVK